MFVCTYGEDKPFTDPVDSRPVSHRVSIGAQQKLHFYTHTFPFFPEGEVKTVPCFVKFFVLLTKASDENCKLL